MHGKRAVGVQGRRHVGPINTVAGTGTGTCTDAQAKAQTKATCLGHEVSPCGFVHGISVAALPRRLVVAGPGVEASSANGLGVHVHVAGRWGGAVKQRSQQPATTP